MGNSELANLKRRERKRRAQVASKVESLSGGTGSGDGGAPGKEE